MDDLTALTDDDLEALWIAVDEERARREREGYVDRICPALGSQNQNCIYPKGHDREHGFIYANVK